jgi:hypothetical protein
MIADTDPVNSFLGEIILNISKLEHFANTGEHVSVTIAL